jgi:hypothetical protein
MLIGLPQSQYESASDKVGGKARPKESAICISNDNNIKPVKIKALEKKKLLSYY